MEKFICTLSLESDPSNFLNLELYYKDLNDNVPEFVTPPEENIDIKEVVLLSLGFVSLLFHRFIVSSSG